MFLSSTTFTTTLHRMFTKHFRRKSFSMNGSSSSNVPIIMAQLQSETLGELFISRATSVATSITTTTTTTTATAAATKATTLAIDTTTIPSIYTTASANMTNLTSMPTSLWSSASLASSSSSSSSSSLMASKSTSLLARTLSSTSSSLTTSTATTTTTTTTTSSSSSSSSSISSLSSSSLSSTFLSTYLLYSNTIKFWRIFTIICCLLILFVNKISSAGYFELEILEISNTNSHLLNGYCCGVPLSIRNTKTTGCPSCSTAFRLCLKEYSAVDLGTTTTSIGCSFGNSSTSILGGSSFVLSDPGRGAIVLPFTFRWTKSFTLILQALDMYNTSYPDSERLIEEASFSGVILPSPEWKTLDHIGRNARITYRVRVQCAATYYNTTCTTFCRSRNDQFGHYTCGSLGEKICLNGWMGDNCEIAICKPGCDPIHGYCQQPGECDCRQGWQGPLCNECKVYPGCKHGSCDGTAWTCRCDTNWGGILCDQDLNYCGTHEPCKHGGTCQNTAPDKFHCTCAEGLSGERCEIVEHPCATQPCKNSGTCTVKELTLSKITTMLPYRTRHGMSSAMGKPVSGHNLSLTLQGLAKKQITTSTSRSNSRSISSSSSSSGRGNSNNIIIHGINGISDSSLNNGGKIANNNINNNNNNNNNNHHHHHHQQQQQQQHQQHLQQQQQQQMPLVAEFTCACTPGWTGPTCEINIDECAGGPCTHGGTCIDLIGGFRCECPPEWTGDVCQVDINECEITYPSVHFNSKSMYATTISDASIIAESRNVGSATDSGNTSTLHASTTAVAATAIATSNSRSIPSSSLSSPSSSSSSSAAAAAALIAALNIASSNLMAIASNGNVTNDSTIQLGPCINAHKCINLPGSFQCICLEGWGGPTCAKDYDDCLGQCKNGATCIDLVNDYHCACATGFTGRDCETDIDECANMPCRNGGECVDMIGKFNCICPLGYSGTLCEEANDHCTPSPCLQGRCLNTPGSYYCHCPPGRSGKHCEKNRTLCSQSYCNEGSCFSNASSTRNSLPCNGHGNCEMGDVGRFCKCHNGYTGTFCEHNLNECTPNPCHNGGICIDGDGDFMCECAPGWTGKRCSEQATECFEGQCKNGGTCVRNVSPKSRNQLAHCRCTAGWEGVYCTEAIDQCRDQPCHNGGTCESGTGWFRCVCAAGFSGPDCRINVNECSPQPCQGGATCIDGIGGFTCICPAGRHGLRCEILLSDSKSTCINKTTITASPYSPLNTSQDILTQVLMGHTDDYCNSCLCDNGTSRCSNIWCGLPNCFKNNISGSCKQHEVCVPSLSENCLQGPCPLRGDCRALEPSHRVAPPRLPAHPDCWPNQATLKDNCARLTILLDKPRLSPGSSVEGLCSVIRFLLASKLITLPKGEIEGTLIVICDLKIGTNDTIEVTVSSTEINDSQLPLAVNLIGELLSARQINNVESKNELKTTKLAALVSILEVKVETASVAEAISNSLLIGILCGIFLVLIGLAICLSLFFRQRILISSTSGINLAPSLDALRHEEEKSNNLQNEENLRRYTNPLKGSTASLGRVNGIELNLNPTPELKTGVCSLSVTPTTSSTLHRSQPLYPACESNFDNELDVTGVVATSKAKEFHSKRGSQILLHKTQNSDMKKNTMGSIDSPRKDFGKRSINCKSMPLPPKVVITSTITTAVTNSTTTNTTTTNTGTSNLTVNNCNDPEILTVLV